MAKPFLAALFLLLCFNSVSQTSEIDVISKKIDNAIRNQPDSLKIYMLQLLEYSDRLPDSVLIKTYGNLGVFYNSRTKPDSAVFYLEKAIIASEKYPLKKAHMYYNLGVTYRTAARYKESFQVLDSAFTLYDAANDKAGKGIVYGEMASNYSYMLQNEKALEYLKKSLQLLNEVGEKKDVIIIKQKLANLYLNSENYTFAKDLYEELLPEFKKNLGANYYFTLINYADCLFWLKAYNKAENALNEAKNGLDSLNIQEFKWVAVSKLGDVYVKTNNTAKAETSFKNAFNGLYELKSPRFMEIANQYLDFLNSEERYAEALKVVEKINTSLKMPGLKINATNEIYFLKKAVTTYSKTGHIDKSLASFERIDFLKDSINYAEIKLKTLEMQQAYQNELQREKNAVLKKNNALLTENSTKKDRIIILSICVFLLIIAIGLVLIISNKNKMRLQKEMLVSLEFSKKAMEDKQRMEAKFHTERSRALANKEKELVEVSLEMADLQNKLVEEINQWEKEEGLTEMATNLKSLLNQKNYWKYFKGKFVEVHPHFASLLKEMFPNLSENEIAFCCMLKIQLSNIEIASLMGKSEEEIAQKIDQLKRKMGLSNDPLSFYQLITHME